MSIVVNKVTHPTDEVTEESKGPPLRAWLEQGVDMDDVRQSLDGEHAGL